MAKGLTSLWSAGLLLITCPTDIYGLGEEGVTGQGSGQCLELVAKGLTGLWSAGLLLITCPTDIYGLGEEGVTWGVGCEGTFFFPGCFIKVEG